MSVLLAFCTAPDESSAKALADALLERRLAACVSRLPGVRSSYRWQGRIEQADEVLLLIKTTRERFAELREAVQALHPYEVPELLALEAHDGLAAYLAWVQGETRVTPG